MGPWPFRQPSTMNSSLFGLMVLMLSINGEILSDASNLCWGCRPGYVRSKQEHTIRLYHYE